jgi:hypothetical protein
MEDLRKYKDSLKAKQEQITGEDIVEIIFNHPAKLVNSWANEIKREKYLWES